MTDFEAMDSPKIGEWPRFRRMLDRVTVLGDRVRSSGIYRLKESEVGKCRSVDICVWLCS